jgi:predicted glutamine amidotransferase
VASPRWWRTSYLARITGAGQPAAARSLWGSVRDAPPCPARSLAEQSEAAGYTPGEPQCAQHRSRNHAVNVHGCGIGWYGDTPGAGLVDALGLCSYERPAVYTTTSAPSHDRNLRSLSKMVESSLLFGHVRAAGPGAAVHLYNTHPFSCGRYLFQHNGALGNFSKIRRALLARLRDCLFEWLSGTTDSELLFALFLNALPDCVSLQPPEVLAAALKDTIRLVVEAAGGEPSSINVSCTDGECVLATRFRDGLGETAPSLCVARSCEQLHLAMRRLITRAAQVLSHRPAVGRLLGPAAGLRPGRHDGQHDARRPAGAAGAVRAGAPEQQLRRRRQQRADAAQQL